MFSLSRDHFLHTHLLMLLICLTGVISYRAIDNVNKTIVVLNTRLACCDSVFVLMSMCWYPCVDVHVLMSLCDDLMCVCFLQGGVAVVAKHQPQQHPVISNSIADIIPGSGGFQMSSIADDARYVDMEIRCYDVVIMFPSALTYCTNVTLILHTYNVVDTC